MILINTFSPVVQKENDIHQPFFTVYTYYHAIHTTMFCIVHTFTLIFVLSNNKNHL
jgi:hypothetical protein